MCDGRIGAGLRRQAADADHARHRRTRRAAFFSASASVELAGLQVDGRVQAGVELRKTGVMEESRARLFPSCRTTRRAAPCCNGVCTVLTDGSKTQASRSDAMPVLFSALGPSFRHCSSSSLPLEPAMVPTMFHARLPLLDRTRCSTDPIRSHLIDTLAHPTQTTSHRAGPLCFSQRLHASDHHDCPAPTCLQRLRQDPSSAAHRARGASHETH